MLPQAHVSVAEAVSKRGSHLVEVVELISPANTTPVQISLFRWPFSSLVSVEERVENAYDLHSCSSMPFIISMANMKGARNM